MKKILHLCDCSTEEARAIFKERMHHYGLPWTSMQLFFPVPRNGRPLNLFEVEAMIISHGAKTLLIDSFDVSASEARAWEQMATRHGVQMIAFASDAMLADRLHMPAPDGVAVVFPG